jgi:hypothetical protein
MWEPQPLATLRASTACTGITLPLHICIRRPPVLLAVLLCHRFIFDYSEFRYSFD